MREIFKVLPLEDMLAVSALIMVAVNVAVFIDLVAGYRKAKKAGQQKRSIAMRRTVDKFVRYDGCVLIALFMDVFVSILAKKVGYAYDVPVCALLWGVYCCYTEFISVRENSDVKMQRRQREAADSIQKVLEACGYDKVSMLVGVMTGNASKGCAAEEGDLRSEKK